MTLRVTTSSITIGAGASNVEVISAITGLTDFVPATVSVQPTAIEADTAPAADVTVTEAIIRATKNPENSHRVYKGSAIKLSELLKAMGRDARKSGVLTPMEYIADHGVELVLKASNGGGSPYTSTLIWDLDNATTVELPTAAKGKLAFLAKSLPPLFLGKGRASSVLSQLIGGGGTDQPL